MSSNADYSTALATMKSANNDMLALIRNLQDLLTSSAEVTFTLGDGTSISVPSLNYALDALRNGKFDTLTIGSQATGGTLVKLSVDSNGNLKVTDSNDEAVAVNCDGVFGSEIKKCTVTNVEAENCYIPKAYGTVSVTGGRVEVNNFNADDLNVNFLTTNSINTGDLSINGYLSATDVFTYGTRRLAIKTVRNIFYRPTLSSNGPSGSIIDYAATNIKTNIDGNNGKWSTSNMDNGNAHIIGLDTNTVSTPGMVCIQGINKYDDFKKLKPNNVDYYNPIKTTSPTTGVPFDTYEFPAVIVWPCGKLSGNGGILFSLFPDDYVGSDVYYQTGSSDWYVYRTLTYDSYSDSCEFGELYRIPKYSCIRFIANNRILDTPGKIVMSVLEIA